AAALERKIAEADAAGPATAAMAATAWTCQREMSFWYTGVFISHGMSALTFSSIDTDPTLAACPLYPRERPRRGGGADLRELPRGPAGRRLSPRPARAPPITQSQSPV